MHTYSINFSIIWGGKKFTIVKRFKYILLTSNVWKHEATTIITLPKVPVFQLCIQIIAMMRHLQTGNKNVSMKVFRRCWKAHLFYMPMYCWMCICTVYTSVGSIFFVWTSLQIDRIMISFNELQFYPFYLRCKIIQPKSFAVMRRIWLIGIDVFWMQHVYQRRMVQRSLWT